MVLRHHTFWDRWILLEFVVHVPNEGKKVGVLAPVIHFDADEQVLSILGNLVVDDAMHHVN